MGSFTQSGIIIGVIILFTVTIAVIERIFHHIRYKRRLAILDNYGRDLTGKEIAFLEDAQAKLIEKRNIAKTYPKWYGWFLALAYVPLMLLGFGLAFWAGYETSNFLSQRVEIDPQLLISENMGFGPSALVFLFALIMLPGWILYAISRRSVRLSNYVALNSDVWGFDSDAIIARQAALLDHRVRAKEILSEKPFDVDVFLDGRNASYQRGCKNTFLVLTLFSIIFLCFDLQYSRKAYPDKIISSGGYFNILDNIEYKLHAIDSIQLNCSFSKGNPRAYYRLHSKGAQVMEINLTAENLNGLSKLNKILRKQNTQFVPHTKEKNGEIVRTFFSERCVDAISDEFPDKENDVIAILKLSNS